MNHILSDLSHHWCVLHGPQDEETYLMTSATKEDSNQSEQSRGLSSLRCLHEGTLHPWPSKKLTVKILIRLRKSTG